MIQSSIPDYQKKELQLSLNAFEEPSSLSGKRAWIELLLHVLFTIKGTYPSDPEYGIGLQLYEYEFIDDVINDLQEQIELQRRSYLPDIPISNVKLEKTTLIDGKTALLVYIEIIDDNSVNSTAVIASTIDRGVVNFGVSL